MLKTFREIGLYKPTFILPKIYFCRTKVFLIFLNLQNNKNVENLLKTMLKKCWKVENSVQAQILGCWKFVEKLKTLK